MNEQAARWRDTVDLWGMHGAGMLANADHWHEADQRMLTQADDGSDDAQDEARRGSRTAADDERRRDEAQANRYRLELATLLKRVDADLNRLTTLKSILVPDQPDRLTSRELLAPQVAADGWCVSCHRDDGWCEPVWEGRSRDGCQWCSRWRTSEGSWPPVALVRWRHRNPGRALTTADVARLMGKAS